MTIQWPTLKIHQNNLTTGTLLSLWSSEFNAYILMLICLYKNEDYIIMFAYHEIIEEVVWSRLNIHYHSSF